MARTAKRIPFRPVLAAVAALAAAGPACAQDEPDERDSTRDLAPRPGSPESIAPSTPPTTRPVLPGLRDAGAIPGLTDADYRLSPSPLFREGTFLVARRGGMVRIPSGEWAFVYHKDDKGSAPRPMILLPSQGLARMEQAAGEKPQETVFTVSGQVFAYHGRNYLLPEVFGVAQAESPGTDPANAGGERAPAPGPMDDPALRDLIKDLERERDKPRTLTPRTLPPSEKGRAEDPGSPHRPDGGRDKVDFTRGGTVGPVTAADSGLLGEGTFLIRRKGRLVRQGGGEWALAFDADAGADAATDRPMVVVPCLNLERMETLAGAHGEMLSFEVSGRVLVYQGRNYLTPGLFQVVPAGDVKPRR